VDIIPAEIIGTALLILLGDGVVAAVLLARSKAENGGWIVITFGWGFAVMVGAYAVAQFSGAHLNPAVTVGFLINGNVTFGEAIQYFIGEFVGAMIGATLVLASYWQHFQQTEDPGLKLAVFSTGPAIRNPFWNLVTEIIGTFVLVLGILAIAADPGQKGIAASGLNLLLVAFIVVAIGLSLGGPTGYAINPARDLGPRIMHAILPIAGKGPSDWGYAWVPVLGPLIGAALAALLFNVAWPDV
jgi:glycerol uptake facilitator protein